ncbi:MAG: UvrD-helicase domain-containing protein [Dehalococcoidia bacterium]
MTEQETGDQAVRDQLVNDLDTCFFVEAGAGTGKTRIVVDRVFEVIRRRVATIDQMAVITFTEKAAGELRGRIRERLADGRTKLDNADERRALDTALRALDSAHIETIHAFASRLLREHPVEARLDPNFEQLDEITSELDFRERWGDWLWGAEAADALAVERCLRLRMPLDHIRGVASLMARFRELPFAPSTPTAPDPDRILEDLVDALAELTPLVMDCHRPDDACLRRFETLRAQVHELRGLPPYLLEPALCELAGSAQLTRVGRQGNWVPAASLDTMRIGLTAILERLNDFRDAVHTQAFSALVATLDRFVRQSAAERLKAGLLNFDDLLIEARRLLREQPEVLRQLRRTYRCLFVDEFQDTDPLQAEIVFLIAGVEGDNAGVPWHHLLLRPGSLFLVGDPKQSIYRFRRADIDSYAMAKAAFARAEPTGVTAVRDITRNFRSAPELIGWINRTFAETIKPVPGFPDAQPTYLPLEPHRAPENQPGAAVICPQNDRPPDQRVGEIREAEAAGLARLIRSMVGSWEVRDPDAPVRRLARYDDICVLVPNRTDIDLYVRALRDAGIPHLLDGGRTFFQRQEVRELAAMLRALDDPSDTISLVAALRSEAFACSDIDLLQYRVDGGRLSLGAEPVGDGPVAAAIARLRSLNEARSDHSLPAFVDLVLRESMLVESQLWAGDRQRASNLKLVVDRAADFAASKKDALRPFVRWLSQREGQASAEQESQVAEPDEEVVRVMTVHGAKGLEFPIVILAKLAAGSSTERREHVIDRSLNRLELRVVSGDREWATPGFGAAWAREQVYQDAEDARQMYVACTRARDHLVLSEYRSDANLGFHRFFRAPRLSEPAERAEQRTSDGALVVIDSELPQPAPIVEQRTTLPENFVSRWEAQKLQLSARLESAPRYVAPSAVTGDSVKRPRETEPDDRSEAERDLDLVGDGERALSMTSGGDGVRYAGSSSARTRGALVHEALFRCDFADPQRSSAIAAEVCVDHGCPEQTDEVTRHVSAALESRLMDRVRQAPEVLREVPVVWFEDDRYVEGFVDLMFGGPDEWTIVDYKTDRLSSSDAEVLVRRYGPQLELYRDALRAAGANIREVGVLATDRGIAAFL